ncbi:MAG: hypothetical protein KME20_18780 [Kaiparowitsia implicata GSE-PSE-MK54-09C]|jgi:pyruvate,water dikinase|nr:hypothetical protein [Kaiparowitsia implicata GSE-PSE-MK54-09C]
MVVAYEQSVWKLADLHHVDRTLVGDKAYELGVLAQRGYPTLPGLCISAWTFRQFLQAISWPEPLFADLPDSALYLDVNNPRQLQAIARQIRQAIIMTPLWEGWSESLLAQMQGWDAPAVIVRPSIAVQSGYDAVLASRIRGLLASSTCAVDADALSHSIRQVWAELFRAKSLFYWQRSRLPLNLINLGLLVQPMYGAIAAGEVQTSSSQVLIRATWGEGCGLVNGNVESDRYTLNFPDGVVQSQQISVKPAAYRLTLPTSAPTPAASAPPAQPLIQRQAIAVAEQHQSVLSPEHLASLWQTACHLQQELGHALELEWVQLPSRLGRPNWSITQITPRLDGRQNDRTGAIAPESPTAKPVASAHHFKASSQNTQGHTQGIEQSLEHGAHAEEHTTLTGQAAAPGTRLGRVRVWDAGSTPLIDQDPIVLVLPAMAPDSLPWVQHAVALITEQGGMTSHAAIVAREMGIPAVVAVANVMQHLASGDWVCVDGDRGVVTRLPSNASSHECFQQLTGAIAPNAPVEQPPALSTATAVLLNLSQPQQVANAAALPVDGIGLLRGEHVLMQILDGRSLRDWRSHPTAATQLAQQIQAFTTAFAPRPVFYRTADLRSHEFGAAHYTLPEPNPILGLHGTLSYQIDPHLFELELSALRQVQQSGRQNLHLLLPFVRTVEEFVWCRERVAATGLLAAGCELWGMAEVPSMLFLIPDLVQAGMQGISIGSNDLTQLMLAVDRDHVPADSPYNAAHPAVWRAIQHLVRAAAQAGIPCSICGEAPVLHPQMIADLVHWGITSISVAPAAVAHTRWAIAQAERSLRLNIARQS